MATTIAEGSVVISIAELDKLVSDLNTANQKIKAVGDTAEAATAQAGKDGGLGAIVNDWRVQLVAAAAAGAALTGKLVEMFKAGGEKQEVVSMAAALDVNLEAAKMATQGLLTETQALQAVMQSREFGYTAEQFETIAAYAKRASIILGGDFRSAISEVMSAVASGRVIALRRLGIDLGDVAEGADKTALALDAMNKKLAETPDLDSAADKVERLGVAWRGFIEYIENVISRSTILTTVVTGLTDSIKLLTGELDKYSYKSQFGAEYDRLLGVQAAQKKMIDELRIYGSDRPDLNILFSAEEIATGKKRLNEWLAAYAETEKQLVEIAGKQMQSDAFNIPLVKLQEAAKIAGTSAGKELAVSMQAGWDSVNLDEFLGNEIKVMSEYLATTTLLQTPKGELATFNFAGFDAAQLKNQQAEITKILREQYAANLIDYEFYTNAMADLQIAADARALEINREAYQAQLAEQQAYQRQAADFWNMFGGGMVNVWVSMWQDIAAGDGFKNLLYNFLNMLAQMAIQLGTMVMLAGVAMQVVPIFGNISGAAAIAAGAALTAFGGVLKGITAGMQKNTASARSGSALGATGSSTGGWAGTASANNAAGSVVNITINGGLSTAEDIAKELEKVISNGRNMGYSY